MGCRRCHLWKLGTQTVFGEGPSTAELMFVGEQPGDVEDREGEPFVGPAGQLLRQALAEAGIDAGTVYLTNAVKHFKWRPKGKRRIHEFVTVTVHPSSILRAPDAESRARERKLFVGDLKRIATRVRKMAP